MKRSIRIVSLIASVALTGCASFGPASDPQTVATLTLPSADLPKAGENRLLRIDTTLPSYLDTTTIYSQDPQGFLAPVPGFRWAEPLSLAISREVQVGIGDALADPSLDLVELTFSRFILESDGSAQARLAVVGFSDNRKALFGSELAITLPKAWDPSKPRTFLEGYRALLAAVFGELKTVRTTDSKE